MSPHAPGSAVRSVRLGVVGTGWIGAIRARTAAANPLVGELHLADIAPGVGERVAAETGALSWTHDHRRLLDGVAAVDAVIVSTAPETSHYPLARDCLQAGKHVLLEKPMGLTLGEADELVELARARGVKLMVGYTQRFHPKFAYVKRCRTVRMNKFEEMFPEALDLMSRAVRAGHAFSAGLKMVGPVCTPSFSSPAGVTAPKATFMPALPVSSN